MPSHKAQKECGQVKFGFTYHLPLHFDVLVAQKSVSVYKLDQTSRSGDYLSPDTESINFLSSPKVWGGWLNLAFCQGKKTFGVGH